MAKKLLPEYKYTCVSTAHIMPTDDKILQEQSEHITPQLICDHFAYGYWVHIPTGPINEEVKTMIKLGFSAAFVELFKLAWNERCHFIKIDRDGDGVDGLPKFEW